MSERKLLFAAKLKSENPDAFAIVNSSQTAGHKTAANLTELVAVSDCILSESGTNTNNDAIGQIWYVVSESANYELTNWGNRKSISGWTKQDSINNKQNSSDNSLTTTNKTIVGAINEINGNKVSVDELGENNGVATLDENGKVPSSQLPSYVDDVIDLITISDIAPESASADDKYYNSTDKLIYTAITGDGLIWNNPINPVKGVIYVTIDTNKTWRWSGTSMVEVSQGVHLGETEYTAYRGDRGKTAYNHSQLTANNPHGVTSEMIGASTATNLSNGTPANSLVQYNTTVTNENEVALGKYNESVLNETAFSIGNGTSEEAKNIFSVSNDGDVKYLDNNNEEKSLQDTLDGKVNLLAVKTWTRYKNTSADYDGIKCSKIFSLPANSHVIMNYTIMQGFGNTTTGSLYFSTAYYNQLTTLSNDNFSFPSLVNGNNRYVGILNQDYSYPFNPGTIKFQIVSCSCDINEITWYDTRNEYFFGSTYGNLSASTIKYYPNPSDFSTSAVVAITDTDKTNGYSTIDMSTNVDFLVKKATLLPDGFYFKATNIDLTKMYRFAVDCKMSPFTVKDADENTLFSYEDDFYPGDILTAVPPLTEGGDWELSLSKNSIVDPLASLWIRSEEGRTLVSRNLMKREINVSDHTHNFIFKFQLPDEDGEKLVYKLGIVTKAQELVSTSYKTELYIHITKNSALTGKRCHVNMTYSGNITKYGYWSVFTYAKDNYLYLVDNGMMEQYSYSNQPYNRTYFLLSDPIEKYEIVPIDGIFDINDTSYK